MSWLRRLVFGAPGRIAGTVYGTIVVMGAIAASMPASSPTLLAESFRFPWRPSLR